GGSPSRRTGRPRRPRSAPPPRGPRAGPAWSCRCPAGPRGSSSAACRPRARASAPARGPRGAPDRRPRPACAAACGRPGERGAWADRPPVGRTDPRRNYTLVCCRVDRGQPPSPDPSQEAPMELYEVMRTTFSARQFTDDPVSDEVLVKILDNARFAPSGGNRQGWRGVGRRHGATKAQLGALSAPAAKRYAAQVQAGESPWNTVDPTSVTPEVIERTPAPERLTDSLKHAPVVLVVCVDLKVVASIDYQLPRVGVV